MRKAENMIIHSEEINSRAPRKWIQTKKEKEDAKRKSVEAHLVSLGPPLAVCSKNFAQNDLARLLTHLDNHLSGQRAAERYVSGEEDETGGAGKA